MGAEATWRIYTGALFCFFLAHFQHILTAISMRRLTASMRNEALPFPFALHHAHKQQKTPVNTAAAALIAG